MTQLIENKPRRHALIATLLHFYPSRRFVGRSFRAFCVPIPSGSSDITDDARSAYRCADSPAEGLAAVGRAACICSCDQLPERLISNRLSCQLEFAVTACKQTTARVSNRRNSANYSFVQNSYLLPLAIQISNRESGIRMAAKTFRANKSTTSNREFLQGVISAFFVSSRVFTPMKQRRRSRFRGALALRYPPRLLAQRRICSDAFIGAARGNVEQV
jgi:hypothetical protein